VEHAKGGDDVHDLGSLQQASETDDLHGEARKVIDRMKERTGQELTEREVIDSPHLFIGSVERFVEKFGELRGRLGVNSFLVGSLDELGPVVERLAGT